LIGVRRQGMNSLVRDTDYPTTEGFFTKSVCFYRSRMRMSWITSELIDFRKTAHQSALFVRGASPYIDLIIGACALEIGYAIVSEASTTFRTEDHVS